MSTPAFPPGEPEIVDKPWGRPVQKRLTDWMRQVRDLLATQQPARHARTHMVGGGDALPLDKLTLPGDLLTKDGSGYARLGADLVDGHVLTIDTTLPKKIKWAAPSGGSGSADDAMFYAFFLSH